jgi:DNA-binding MarR family transcriptional regulator
VQIKNPAARTSYLAWQFTQAAEPLLEEVLHPLGLGLSKWHALVHATLAPGISSAEVARRSGVTAQSMGAIVCALVDAGLLTRTPHPTNRRILQLHVTEEGRRVTESAEAAIDGVQEIFLEGFDAAEREALNALLRRLVTVVNPDALHLGGR